MTTSLPVKTFIEDHGELFLDARSPIEYHQGHLPGAVNFPLFSDEERAQVGICYKHKGAREAMLLGLEFVGPKMADFIRQASALNPRGRTIRLYCFRGGQRSQSLAWLLDKGGFKVEILEGGYKAYRRHVLASFEEPQEILILSGCTGSGKTRVLYELKARGEQMIDLEGLACHRGSAFGGYHQPESLTSEMFSNLIYAEWKDLDRDRRVWIEDESRTLGKLVIPDEFWVQMRRAPVVLMEIPQEHRVKFLVEEYGEYDEELLRRSIDRIAKRLGGLEHRHCIEALDSGDQAEVVRICLNYYDRAYRYGLDRREPETVWRLELDSVETEKNTQELLNFLSVGKVI